MLLVHRDGFPVPASSQPHSPDPAVAAMLSRFDSCALNRGAPSTTPAAPDPCTSDIQGGEKRAAILRQSAGENNRAGGCATCFPATRSVSHAALSWADWRRAVHARP